MGKFYLYDAMLLFKISISSYSTCDIVYLGMKFYNFSSFPFLKIRKVKIFLSKYRFSIMNYA